MQQLNESLYSRQLAVYGAETQAKLMQMRCFLYGLKGLGVEIAKNLILAGPAEVCVFDDSKVEVSDLAANFYCGEKHVSRATRQEACIQQLSELNPNVKVHAASALPSVEELSSFNVVVMTDCWDKGLLVEVNEATRKKKNGFIFTHCSGLFGSAFVDYGDEFEVHDSNGEQVKSTIVAGITREASGIVSGDDKKRHGFQDGDYVTFREVQGMHEVNDKVFQIKVVSPFTFSIGDTSHFSDYQREGICEQVKVPVKVHFKSFAASLLDPHAPGRDDMDICDWEKMDRPEALHQVLALLLDSRFPADDKQLQTLLEAAKSKGIQDLDLVASCARYGNLQISPMVSFWGGIVAQEVVKWTGKFNPLRQWLHHEFFEALPQPSTNQLTNSRYDPYLSLFGHQTVNKIHDSKFFMVGAGALGCEFIKMFTLMGVGQLVVTDDDNIEMSNLNRQFLFRKKDVGKNKAECACRIGREINPDSNIHDKSLRVGPKSENVFNDEFWESLTLAVNAVDNVQARRYIDDKCCYYSKALFESGTLGTKCNSQLILPFQTQSYSESQDPPEEGIPLCTLKNFPYQIEHTIQWARDYFEGIFVEGSVECSNFLQDSVNYLKRVQREFRDQPSVLRGKLEVLKSYIDIVLNKNYDKCVELSRNLFEDIFTNQINQLLYCFPLDHKTEEGNFFWTNPKRPPISLQFDENDQEHLNFVQSCANIFAFIFDLPYENNRNNLKKILTGVKVQKFEVKKNVVLKENEQDKREEKSEDDEEQIEKLVNQLQSISVKSLTVNKVEFEKDDPTNWHIDFVSSVANLRARNYKIKEVSPFQVKLIAGKIIPALATTTAMIVGAVGIEILKYLQKKELDKMRNSFINLALPLFLFSQPLPPTEHQDQAYNEIYLGPIKGVPKNWTAWDRITIKGPMKIKEFMEHFKTQYNVSVTSIIYGQVQLFSTFPQPPQDQQSIGNGYKRNYLKEIQARNPKIQKVYRFDSWRRLYFTTRLGTTVRRYSTCEILIYLINYQLILFIIFYYRLQFITIVSGYLLISSQQFK